MTFFLPENANARSIPAPGPDIGPTSFIHGLGAAFSKSAMENDANFRLRRESMTEIEQVAGKAAPLLGTDAVRKVLEDRNEKARSMGLMSQIVDIPSDPEAMIAAIGPNGATRVLELAREAALANPEQWKGVDLSDEGMEARVNQRLQAEHRDQNMTLDAMGWGRGVAEFIGGMGGMTADVKNLPFLAIGGGGGSIFRQMAREGAINASAEAAFLPSQFEMAERLDIPDPDVVSQLMTAAVAGAAFQGAVSGVGRAWEYWNGRNQLPEMDFEPDDIEAAVQAAETALINGEDPIIAADKVFPREPLVLERPLPPEGRPPLITAPEPTPLAPDPITTESLPPAQGEAPQTTGELAAMAERAIGKAAPKQVLSYFRRTGVDPDGWLGRELKGMGLTHKSYPGLFKKGGISEIDNIVADELDQTIPGISYRAGRDDTGNYIDRAGLLRVFDEELRPQRAAPDTRSTPEKDFLDGKSVEGGLFIDKNAGGLGLDADIERRFDDWIASRPDLNFLRPGERAEIVQELQQRGGEAEYLVEQTLSREMDWVETGSERADATPSNAGRASGAGSLPPGTFPDEAGSGAARAGGGVRNAPAQDLAVGGANPTGMSLRQRAEVAARAQQSKIRRLDQARVEDDAGGLFGGTQNDMFSDPIKARPVHEQMAADLRDFAEQNGNPTVDLDDGRGARTMTEALDDMDAEDEFAEMLGLCGARNVPF
jgi:hypothetical protein